MSEFRVIVESSIVYTLRVVADSRHDAQERALRNDCELLKQNRQPPKVIEIALAEPVND